MLRETLTQFFDAYLVRRNLEESLSFLSDGVISLGTGAQEVALDKGELRELMRAEFESIPSGFQYQLTHYQENEYREDLRGGFCTMLVSMTDGFETELSFQTRLTFAALKDGGCWKLFSLHMSTPSDQQEEGEFFPIKYGRKAIGKLNPQAGKKLIELMLSMLPGGIIGGYLEDGLPLYIINDTMLNYLGYTYEEFVEETGEEMQKIIAPEDWERVRPVLFDTIKQTGECDVQYRVIRKDGTRLWVNDKGHEIVTEDGRRAMVSVILDINESIRMQERLLRESMEDPLTGILNRKGAIFRIEQSLAARQPGALFLLDIDNFKQLNDSYGHLTGDRILQLLAEIMRKNSREGDVAARIGGDEFLLFLPGCTEERVLRKKAQSICSGFWSAGSAYSRARLSVSIGIAVTRESHTNFDRLFKEADDRLYAVKNHGKGSYRFADEPSA